MAHMNHLVLGPPGTGKTTYLLAQVEQHIGPIQRVGFVAFTRPAAYEARSRMLRDNPTLDEDALPYFRTLHSIAYRELKLNKQQILDDAKLRKMAAVEGWELTAKGNGPDDIAHAAYNASRARCCTLTEAASDFDIDLEHVEAFRAFYDALRDDQTVFDFTDMLERFIEDCAAPSLDILFVDEAQDLSTLQWKMVDKFAADTPEVWYAGDDDQAIYQWAGADIERFRSLEAERIVLDRSWRLPVAVYKQALTTISDLSDRYKKAFHPRNDAGHVGYIDSLAEVDLSTGTWYLLARNAYLLRPWARHLWHNGVPFHYYDDTAERFVTSGEHPQVLAMLARARAENGEALPDDAAIIDKWFSDGSTDRIDGRVLDYIAACADPTMQPDRDTIHYPPGEGR